MQHRYKTFGAYSVEATDNAVRELLQNYFPFASRFER